MSATTGKAVSTLADWVGTCAATLMPLVRIRAHVLAAERIHADEARRQMWSAAIEGGYTAPIWKTFGCRRPATLGRGSVAAASSGEIHQRTEAVPPSATT
jgi:hypothetical protein